VKDNPGFFVAAEGGTLFLDEITEVDAETQVRLLRAIQEREVVPVGGTTPVKFDVRMIAATNRDLREALAEGSLREDLYYRLSVVVIEIPPLRDRREDVRALTGHFAARLSAEYGLAPREVTPEAMRILEAHRWPGNVRQLENAIERAFALGAGPAIGPEDLPPEVVRAVEGGEPAPLWHGHLACAPGQAESLSRDGRPLSPSAMTLEEAEKSAVASAVEAAGGNKTEAARILGIERKRLYRLLHRHDLM
jgi:two-component system response regulator HydG